MRSSIDLGVIAIGSMAEQNPVIRYRFKPDEANMKQHAGTRKRIHK
ncbi:hypothetical protein [Endozoicomonas sp. ALD040]